MGGEHDSYFRFRMPDSLKKRLDASCKAGGTGAVSQADAIRALIEMRCEFTEAKGRQPNSLAELCRWYLRRKN